MRWSEGSPITWSPPLINEPHLLLEKKMLLITSKHVSSFPLEPGDTANRSHYFRLLITTHIGWKREICDTRAFWSLHFSNSQRYSPPEEKTAKRPGEKKQPTNVPRSRSSIRTASFIYCFQLHRLLYVHLVQETNTNTHTKNQTIC